MIDNKYKSKKVISSKYGRGIEYNDEVEDVDENYFPQSVHDKNENKKVKEFTMRTFPNPDW